MNPKVTLVDDLKIVSSFKNPHDFIGKWGLKHLERFQHFLKIAVKSEEKTNSFDFKRCEFIDTEMSYKSVDGKTHTVHADVLAKLGIRDSEQLVGVIIENTSHAKTVRDLYLQGLKYNLCLLEKGLPPIMTIFLLHGKAPRGFAKDLQGATFGWTSEMRRLFGWHGLNYGPVILDLRDMSYNEIAENPGPASAWLYTLKDVVNLTRERIETIFKICYEYSKDVSSYHKNASMLMHYIRQYTYFSLDHLGEFESKMIGNKEDRVMEIMQSTYDQLINEGLQKGRQEERRDVALNLLKAGIDHKVILDSTGLSKKELEDLSKPLKSM